MCRREQKNSLLSAGMQTIFGEMQIAQHYRTHFQPLRYGPNLLYTRLHQMSKLRSRLINRLKMYLYGDK